MPSSRVITTTFLAVVSVAIACAAFGGPQAATQQSDAPSMSMGRETVIDGAIHPELIPDSTAYRLFFLTIATPLDATAAQQRRERAYLESAGLDGKDLQAAVSVLATFKAQYDKLIKQYDGSVTNANEAAATRAVGLFLLSQRAIVLDTLAQLKARLSPGGMARLEAHVQREKRNMKIAKEAQ
ncbi:MAG: hypothetical protein KGM47_00420 [Acidobacteriota bacterium]|nr:hypothetical protein [Acidobacteriota bacterium]